MNELRIALAQSRQTSDFDQNERTIMRFLEDAVERGVQILCFPETQTVGYRVDVTPTNAPVPIQRLAELHERIARRCGEMNMACILGTETPFGPTVWATRGIPQPRHRTSMASQAEGRPTCRQRLPCPAPHLHSPAS